MADKNTTGGTLDAATDDPDGVELARIAARTADDKKATDIIILDVGEVLAIAGYFVVCSASNRRLVRTVSDEIEAAVKRELGRSPVRTEGRNEQQWILIDYGDVVVHVFSDEQREFYEIERLYLDVPKIEWQPTARRSPGAGKAADPVVDPSVDIPGEASA